MPSNYNKYSEEMRTQTAEHILRSGKSASSVAEELEIDTNTGCRWVRDYRRAKGLLNYSEGKEQQKSAANFHIRLDYQLSPLARYMKEWYSHNRKSLFDVCLNGDNRFYVVTLLCHILADGPQSIIRRPSMSAGRLAFCRIIICKRQHLICGNLSKPFN